VTQATTKSEAFEAFVLEVFRLSGSLLRHGTALTAPRGQTQARWQVLGAATEDRRTVPQIARRMGLARQSVQRLADLLAEEGLVRYLPNPDHARSPYVDLTDAGRRVERELKRAADMWAREVARALKASELQAATSFVRQVIARLDAMNP